MTTELEIGSAQGRMLGLVDVVTIFYAKISGGHDDIFVNPSL